MAEGNGFMCGFPVQTLKPPASASRQVIGFIGDIGMRTQLFGQPVDRVLQPLPHVVVDMGLAGLVDAHLLVGGVHAGQDVARAQRGQHGLEAVFQRQQMRRAAAGGDGQHHLARQRLLVQQVQHGLQAAGERGLVDRGGDQHRVGGRDAGAQQPAAGWRSGPRSALRRECRAGPVRRCSSRPRAAGWRRGAAGRRNGNAATGCPPG